MSKEEIKFIKQEFLHLQQDTVLQIKVFGEAPTYATRNLKEFWAECVEAYEENPTLIAVAFPHTGQAIYKVLNRLPKDWKKEIEWLTIDEPSPQWPAGIVEEKFTRYLQGYMSVPQTGVWDSVTIKAYEEIMRDNNQFTNYHNNGTYRHGPVNYFYGKWHLPLLLKKWPDFLSEWENLLKNPEKKD